VVAAIFPIAAKEVAVAFRLAPLAGNPSLEVFAARRAIGSDTVKNLQHIIILSEIAARARAQIAGEGYAVTTKLADIENWEVRSLKGGRVFGGCPLAQRNKGGRSRVIAEHNRQIMGEKILPPRPRAGDFGLAQCEPILIGRADISETFQNIRFAACAKKRPLQARRDPLKTFQHILHGEGLLILPNAAAFAEKQQGIILSVGKTIIFGGNRLGPLVRDPAKP